MNKIFGKLLVIGTISMLAAANVSYAGKAKTTVKKNTGDDFQLTLSSVPFSKDPKSEFVRQACAPGQSHKKQSKKPTK